MYLPSKYREKFPHLRPGPEQLRKYRNINSGLSVLFLVIAWTTFGYVFVNSSKKDKFSDPKNEDGTIDYKKKHLLHVASRQDEKKLLDGKKVKIVSLGSTGFESYDATEEVKKIVFNIGDEGSYDKYKDEVYLAHRANMSKDDPKFDAGFWGSYFKRIDQGKNRGKIF